MDPEDEPLQPVPPKDQFAITAMGTGVLMGLGAALAIYGIRQENLVMIGASLAVLFGAFLLGLWHRDIEKRIVVSVRPGERL